MGKTNSAIIVFEGRRVPYYVYYRGAEYRCFLYKKKHEVCAACGQIGHWVDVCPRPDKRYCSTCTLSNPPDNHVCELKCAICGKGHLTGDKKCRQRYKTPFLLKQRQWEKQQRENQNDSAATETRKSQKNAVKDANASPDNVDHRSRSNSFPRLPPPAKENGHGEQENAGVQRRSRSRSRRRGTQQGSIRSGSRPGRSGESPVHHNKVSWAGAVSHIAPRSPTTQNTLEPPSALEAELTRIKQMLEVVIRENNQLKAENAQFKAKITSLTAQHARKGPDTDTPVPVPVKCLPSPPPVFAGDDGSPPPKRKAGAETGEPNSQEPSDQLDAKMEARFTKLEGMLSTLAEGINTQLLNLNTRVLGLENAQTLSRQTSGIGPHKSKPYLRPSSGDYVKNTDPVNGHHGSEQQ